MRFPAIVSARPGPEYAARPPATRSAGQVRPKGQNSTVPGNPGTENHGLPLSGWRWHTASIQAGQPDVKGRPGTIRRYGESVRADVRYRLRPGVYAVLPSGGSALLTRQAGPVPEFQLPGGGIDPGESPVVALHREVFEETGWRIASPRRLGAFRRFVYMPEYDLWAEKLCHIYLARPVRPHGPPSGAGHSAVWMPLPKAIERLANDGDRAFARRLL